MDGLGGTKRSECHGNDSQKTLERNSGGLNCLELSQHEEGVCLGGETGIRWEPDTGQSSAQTHTHMHTYTHAHTHTYTHTPMIVWLYNCASKLTYMQEEERMRKLFPALN